MAHDVFISYSSKDKPVADAAVAVLEGRGVRCWVAPRDILPGEDWGESIVDAISQSRALVLIFSEHANESKQIKREVELAVDGGIAVLPVRIEDVQPARSLAYFLSTPHWLDAFTPPLEKHLTYLAETVKHLIAQPNAEGGGAAAPKPRPTAEPAGPRSDARRRALAVIAVVGCAVALLLLVLLMIPDENGDGAGRRRAGGSNNEKNARDNNDETPGDNDLASQGVKPFVGKWRLVSSNMERQQVLPGPPIVAMTIPHTVNAAFDGPGAKSVMTIDAAGSYRADFDITGEGTYVANFTPDRFNKEAGKGTLTFTPKGKSMSDRTSASFDKVTADLPHTNAKKGDSELTLLPLGNSGGATAFWVRSADGGQPKASVVGAWLNQKVYIDSYLPYHSTLELRADGKYRLNFTRVEKGMLDAANGKYHFRRAIAMGPPAQGSYRFDGPDRFTLTEPRGSTTWERVE